MQSQDCVAHCQNPEIVFQSRDCVLQLHDLEIVQV